MRLTKIYVNNFKSLVDFRIDLAKFNCLIGLNGCGKSTFLQFMDFLSQLMEGGMTNWLNKRKWENSSIPFYKDNKDREIAFEISFVLNENEKCNWKGKFDYQLLRCIEERICIENMEFLSVNLPDKRKQEYTIFQDGKEISKSKINFNYGGSVLSQLADNNVPDIFYNFKNEIKSIQTFALLTPYFLKQNAKNSMGSVGYDGEDLTAFLYELSEKNKVNITEKLKKIYPTFSFFKSNVLSDQTKELLIGDSYHKGNLTYQVQSRYVNDGLLRLVAYLAQLESSKNFLLFDEIENGINSELIGFLLKQLIDSEKQICVTTHSLMAVNYLSDEVAIPGVHLFYKTKEGYTRSTPFCKIPRIAEKLEIMGAGEAMIDTCLERLANDLESGFFAKKMEG